jgi:hypothetical protein
VPAALYLAEVLRIHARQSVRNLLERFLAVQSYAPHGFSERSRDRISLRPTRHLLLLVGPLAAESPSPAFAWKLDMFPLHSRDSMPIDHERVEGPHYCYGTVDDPHNSSSNGERLWR